VAFLQRLIGRYQLPTGPVVTITLRGNQLIWQQGQGGLTVMEPEDGTTFVLRSNRTIAMEFHVGPTGPATHIRGTQTGAVFDLPRIP
jgi:hypothetical protein